ncbi:hypothetical protein SKAU_G00390660 [Synaphobranchus kaupii]|uniref:Uncharacterized protein n=1 Tax=Synaphobranchus kaupii TaxID=118154 RepID=A0A9Q1EBH2_SYNKA|nr:hypothetical protein SKAU_G00390660 [Synaphobranchus kaupii]
MGGYVAQHMILHDFGQTLFGYKVVGQSTACASLTQGLYISDLRAAPAPLDARLLTPSPYSTPTDPARAVPRPRLQARTAGTGACSRVPYLPPPPPTPPGTAHPACRP